MTIIIFILLAAFSALILVGAICAASKNGDRAMDEWFNERSGLSGVETKIEVTKHYESD